MRTFITISILLFMGAGESFAQRTTTGGTATSIVPIQTRGQSCEKKSLDQIRNEFKQSHSGLDPASYEAALRAVEMAWETTKCGDRTCKPRLSSAVQCAKVDVISYTLPTGSTGQVKASFCECK